MNSHQPMVLDIKDLIYCFVKKSLLILFVGVIFAGLLFGYKFSSHKNINAVDNMPAVFDTSKLIDGENEVKYSERVSDVNRAKDIINSIDVLNYQIENNRKYVSDSVIMQINAENEAVSTANIIISIDKSNKAKSDIALASTYRQYIMSGEYLNSISEETGINQGYITELISASYENSSIVINSDNNLENVGFISVTVIGPSIEFTDKIMDKVLESVEAKSVEFSKSIVSHTVSYTSRQSAYKVDSSTRDRQISITNRFESLQTQITNYDKSLDGIASKYGVDKSRWYAYCSFSDINVENSSASLKSVIKYTVLGFVLGVFIAVVLIVLHYVFSNKFSTQANFFCRYHGVKKIGVMKPVFKRSRFVQFIDKKSGDDDGFSVENSNKLLAANIKNLTKDMKCVLFTGTAEFQRIEALVKDLGINADVKKSFFVDPTSLESVSKYDGIIIVEQRNYSDCRLVDEELKLISNSKTQLIGAVII